MDTHAEDKIAEDSLPQTQLLRAKDVPAPEIKTWQFADLEQDEIEKETQVRTEVVEKKRRDAEAELLRQTTILKKNAYEKAHQEGYDAGFQKGLELGRKDAKESVLEEERATLKPKIEQIESILELLKKPFNAVEESVYLQLTDLTIQIAQAFLKKQIEADQTWIVEAVKAAIDPLPESDTALEIELHPDDVNIISQYQKDFSQNWAVKPRTDLPRGACRVKQDFSVVENNWQQQLSDYIDKTKDSLHAKEGPVADAIDAAVLE
jgi:flagellar assembly protein FliH